MLPLTALDTWEQLESYGNAEEIPALIEELDKSFSTEILNEICWDCIYHQNSLYLFGKAVCPECEGEFEVFDGVVGPLR